MPELTEQIARARGLVLMAREGPKMLDVRTIDAIEAVCEAAEGSIPPKGVRLVGLTDEDARLLHHALGTTVNLIDAVESEPGNSVPPEAPLYGKRKALLALARRMDHEANQAALSKTESDS